MAEIGTLLAEGEWLRRLARSLCGNAAEADDVVQEVYAAALRSPPDPDRPPRPWLRRVAHNVLRMRRRASGRRVANEAVIEQLAESPAQPDDIVARTRLERRLTELVLELDEPFRTTVLLRYREGLSAEDIAKRDGIPPGTVRRRLNTAIDRLRAELDTHDRDWRAAFAPLVVLRPRRSLWRFIVAKTTTKAAITIAIVLLALLGGGVAWRMTRSSSSTAASGGGGGVVGGDGAGSGGVPSIAAFVQPGVATRTLEGVVLYEGKPFAGAAVRLSDGETRTQLADVTSSSDGRFTFGDRAPAVYVVSATAGDKLAVERADVRGRVTRVALHLARCNTLDGIVTDGSGTPIPHARVVNLEAPTPIAESDARGHYELCTRLGPSRFEYTAGGYGGVTAQLEVAGHATHDVTLVPEATIAGTVVTAAGAPAQDAWVIVDPFDKGNNRRTVVRAHVDRDGAFRIAGVGAGRSQVQAVAPGLVSRRVEVVVGAGQVLEGVVLRVHPGARITGVVTAGDVPVANAPVGIRAGGLVVGHYGDQNQTTLAVTQPDGSFTIDRVPYGDIGVYVDGYTVVAPRNVHVASAQVAAKIEVELLATIRGHVVYRRAPAANAVVMCSMGPLQFSSDDGSYTCRGLPPGQRHVSAYDVEGRWGDSDVVARIGETVDVDIALANDSQVCGRVVDVEGTALRGIEVRLVDPTNGDQGGDVSSAIGAFCVKYMAKGNHQLAAYSNGQRLEVSSPKGLVPIGAGRSDITVVTQAAKLSIAGTIIDPGGAPVADAVVRAQPSNKTGARMFQQEVGVTVSDANGHFEVTRLAPGEFAVLATARDGGEQIVEPIAAGTRDVVITLEPAGRIEGKLVGFSSTPVITGIVQTGHNEPVDAEVDGDRFHASGLPPGTYVLMAVASNHEGDTQKVVVRAGQTTQVTMTSRGSATVVAHVLDYKQRTPLVGARCASTTRNGNDVGVIYNSPDDTVLTDARGEVRLDTPAGEILVTCAPYDHARAVKKLVAQADRTTEVDVLVVPNGPNNGTIDARFEFLGKHVVQLTKGGPAERAGLVLGDEVVTVDGNSVAELDTDSMIALITQRPGGATVVLGVRRGDALKTISVVVRAVDR